MPAHHNEHLSGALTLIFFAFACIAGWITHVVWIITVLSASTGATVGQAVLGVLGAFMFPIGIIHGWIIWVQWVIN